jgi:hypothetical protein
MKKLMKLFTVLAIVMFTSNTFASELGLKMANLNLYAPAAKSKKSSKYFFTDKIGVYGEFGYGKSIFEAGVSIKL